MRAALVCVAAMSLAACRPKTTDWTQSTTFRAPAKPKVPPMPPPPPTSALDAGGADAGASACPRIAAVVRAELVNVPKIEAKTSGGFDPQALVDTCWPAGRGAWGVTLADVAVEGSATGDDASGEKEAHLNAALVVLYAEGEAVLRHPVGRFASSPYATSAVDASVFDWDRDGMGELALVRIERTANGKDTRSGVVLGARQGILGPYPTAPEGFVEVKDVDGDERPDLLIDQPFHAWKALCPAPAAPTWFDGPYLAAHAAADGTFSTTDAAARKYAQDQCSAPPDLDQMTDPKALDFETVRCARLYGTPTSNLLRAIARLCGPPSECNPEKPEARKCPQREVLESAARVEPPFVLLRPDEP